MDMKGKCLCGAVSFTAGNVDTEVHAGHCSMCRSWTGGPLLSVSVQSMHFDDDADLVRYKSSAWAERGFCRKCGSNLFYCVSASGLYVVGMGAFEDQSPFHLASEIYVDEKPGSYAFAGEHPRLTGAEFLASIGLGPPPAGVK